MTDRDEKAALQARLADLRRQRAAAEQEAARIPGLQASLDRVRRERRLRTNRELLAERERAERLRSRMFEARKSADRVGRYAEKLRAWAERNDEDRKPGEINDKGVIEVVLHGLGLLEGVLHQLETQRDRTDQIGRD